MTQNVKQIKRKVKVTRRKSMMVRDPRVTAKDIRRLVLKLKEN